MISRSTSVSSLQSYAMSINSTQSYRQKLENNSPQNSKRSISPSSFCSACLSYDNPPGRWISSSAPDILDFYSINSGQKSPVITTSTLKRGNSELTPLRSTNTSDANSLILRTKPMRAEKEKMFYKNFAMKLFQEYANRTT